MINNILVILLSFLLISTNANAYDGQVDLDGDFDAEEFTASIMGDTQFMGTDNSRHSLSDFRGKIVVINFWGTWCPPCVYEMPALNTFAKDLKDDVVVLAIAESQDGKTDPFSMIRNVVSFYKKHKIDYLVPYADISSDLFTMYDSGSSLPQTIVLDAEGKERFRAPGIMKWETEIFRKRILSFKEPKK